MPQKKTIVVFGATGGQGGGVAHAILNDKNSEFTVRAVTRNPDPDKAKELQFYRDFDEVCNKTRDLKLSRELNPELKTLDKWLSENAQKIPIE